MHQKMLHKCAQLHTILHATLKALASLIMK